MKQVSHRARIALCGLLAALSLAGVDGMILSRPLGLREWSYPSLVFGSTAFLAVALAAGGTRTAYGKCVLAALACCWLGDVVGPGDFYLGLYCFLVAHLAFMAGFLVRGLSERRVLKSALLFLATALIGFGWLHPLVPPGRVLPVFGYLAVISTMMVLAWSSRRGPARGVILLASTLFFASDLFLARSKFTGYAQINTMIGYPMYYGACVLFAWTILIHRLGEWPDAAASTTDATKTGA